MSLRVCYIEHQPVTFDSHSGFRGLIQHLPGQVMTYKLTWQCVERRSWTMGYMLRQWGNRFYGSTWNALVPFWDEYRLSKQIKSCEPCVVHFLWGEFASPRWPGFFRKKGCKLVGGFHCSPRRWKAVLGSFKLFSNYDHITLTSKEQMNFVLEHGVPPENISIIPLGVDTDYFRPSARENRPSKIFKAIMVGETERDHEFLNQVASKMTPDRFELTVRTSCEGSSHYRDNPTVKLLPRLSDSQFLELYQEADLLIMPMLDSAANDVFLESMACGTPVMTNRVGGVPEYIDGSCNYIMDNKNIEDWVDLLRKLMENSAHMDASRNEVRRSVEKFAWSRIAIQYRDLYCALLNSR